MTEPSFDAAVGRSVRALREHRGLSGRQLAERWQAASGLRRTQQTVSDLEGGRRSLKLEEWLQVAYCLDTSPTSLLTNAHALQRFAVASHEPDYTEFRDWIFEAHPLDGQDGSWFRKHATVNLLQVGEEWRVLGNVLENFRVGVWQFEDALAQRQPEVIRHFAGVVRQRLEALERHVLASLAR